MKLKLSQKSLFHRALSSAVSGILSWSLVLVVSLSDLAGQELQPQNSSQDSTGQTGEAREISTAWPQPVSGPQSNIDFSRVLGKISREQITLRSLPGAESFFQTPRRAGYLPAQPLLPYVGEDEVVERSQIQLDGPIALATYESLVEGNDPTNGETLQDGVRTASVDDNVVGSVTDVAKPLEEYKRQFEENAAKIQQTQKPDKELSQADSEKLRMLLEGAENSEKALVEKTNLDNFQKKIDSIVEREKELRSKLESAKEPVVVDPKLTLQELQIAVTANATRIEDEKKKLTELNKRISDQTTMGPALTTKLAETKEKQAAVEAKLVEVDRTKTTQIDSLQVQKILLQHTVDRIQKELEWSRLAQPLFPLQGDLFQINIAREEALNKLLTERISSLRRQETERAAREAELIALNAHPMLQKIAEQTSKLANDRQVFATEIEQAGKQLELAQAELGRIQTVFQEAETQSNDRGNSQSFGLMLRRELLTLPTVAQVAQKKIDLENRSEELSIKASDLNGQRMQSSQRKEELAAKLSQEADAERLILRGNEYLVKQDELLGSLNQDIIDLITKLREQEVVYEGLVDQTRKFRYFIDKNILWIRSAPRIGVDDIEESKQGLAELADAGQLKQNGLWILDRFKQTPLILIGVLAAFVFLFMIRGFLLKRLKRVNADTGLLRIFPVVRSLALSIVLSSVWPGVLAATAWILYSPVEAGTMKASLSLALSVVAPLLFLSQFLQRISMSEGLGAVHLQWSTHLCKAINRLGKRIVLFVLPFYGFTLMVDSFQQGAWSESLGRIAFLLSMAGLFHALTGAMKFLSIHLSEQQQFNNKIFWQWRAIWMGLIMLLPITLAIVSALGWNYSAVQLGNRLLVMILASCAVSSGCCLIYRIACIGQHLVVERRRWQQLRERKKSSDEAAPPVHDEDLDIEGVTSQVAGLMRVVAYVLMALIGWTLWSDVLPAAKFLDEIQIGLAEVEVSETVADEKTGVEHTVSKTELRKVTLADWLIFAGIIVVTFVLSRNIPGLLQVAVLNRLPIDRGGRYAISVICRYIVAIIGIIFASRQVGFSWHNVQWLVAAMGVGLGFGLQEIFANVVSGLIILLERPIRVGDFVTVNGQSGFVTRTQLRATTIIDYERREMIIPNKKFITDDVVNWTLTDSITRVSIPVGIAYGSDTTLAHDTLLEIAHNYPLALKEPEPVAVFNGFGASTLDFELRIFIVSREIISQVKHELHMAIDREFRARKIEIAFPQQDIHIKSFETIPPLELLKSDSKNRDKRDSTRDSDSKEGQRAA